MEEFYSIEQAKLTLNVARELWGALTQHDWDMDYEENQVQKIELASPYWGARRCHFVNIKHETDDAQDACSAPGSDSEMLKLYLETDWDRILQSARYYFS